MEEKCHGHAKNEKKKLGEEKRAEMFEGDI